MPDALLTLAHLAHRLGGVSERTARRALARLDHRQSRQPPSQFRGDPEQQQPRGRAEHDQPGDPHASNSPDARNCR